MRPSALARAARLWAVLALAAGLAACGASSPAVSTEPTMPVPTVAPFFQPIPQPAPTLVPQRAEPTLPSAPVRQGADEVQLVEVPVFDDSLSNSWTLEYSDGMRYDISSGGYVQSGIAAAEVTPLYPASELLFAVQDDALVSYPRDKVMGISFWLSGGANYIDTDDLVVTVLGSNDFPYYARNDRSVEPVLDAEGNDITFSNTRLYFLDINNSIPPDTWVEVVVWLDELIYDPDYNYVTGMYIKNDRAFFDTFYVDNVKLLMLP